MRGGLLCVLAVLFPAFPVPLRGQSAPFTFQGRLLDAGQTANGNYDLQFALTDALTGGNYLGGTLTNAPMSVANGLFTVTLDFGSPVFGGPPRWLEIGVRTNGSAAPYTVLAPRQPITTTPYAVFSFGAATAGVASNLAAGTVFDGASIAAGTITSNQLDAATWSLATNQAGIPALNGAATNTIIQNPIFTAKSASSSIIASNDSGGDMMWIWTPAANTDNQGLLWSDVGGGVGGIYFNSPHGAVNGSDPEIIVESSGSIALKPSIISSGIGGVYPQYRGLQIGGPSDFRAWMYLNSDHAVNGGFGTINSVNSTGASNTLGWSTPLEFLANYGVGAIGGASANLQPAFQLRMTDTNGNGALQLFDNFPNSLNASNTDWSIVGTQPRAQFRVGNTNVGFDVWGTANVYGSLSVTNGLAVSGAITNNGLVWLAADTNGIPAAALPNGSICTTTNGQFFVRSNGVWIPH
jgi:hypothetical protein